MKKEELKEILRLHQLWVVGAEGGERADLRDANLTGANLTGADLTSAYLTSADLWDANLMDAHGNMREIKSIQCDMWQVVYTAEVMQIGCQRHSITDWWAFDDARIERMHSAALEWWRRWKPLLMAIIAASPAVPTGHEAALRGGKGEK